ncbi:hypothetical protein EVG20_g7045 [Dentipellis fragilis]|uniref:Uncharacterized protein n=1 Tax=Dentipellis fragilis TaxID=205917 RepID=A0A4Y9YKJ2_9AGAM|nr:hypothetical protein EVG20_g7045 [Dentipellis fragilis]
MHSPPDDLPSPDPSPQHHPDSPPRDRDDSPAPVSRDRPPSADDQSAPAHATSTSSSTNTSTSTSTKDSPSLRSIANDRLNLPPLLFTMPHRIDSSAISARLRDDETHPSGLVHAHPSPPPIATLSQSPSLSTSSLDRSSVSSPARPAVPPSPA